MRLIVSMFVIFLVFACSRTDQQEDISVITINDTTNSELISEEINLTIIPPGTTQNSITKFAAIDPSEKYPYQLIEMESESAIVLRYEEWDSTWKLMPNKDIYIGLKNSNALEKNKLYTLPNNLMTVRVFQGGVFSNFWFVPEIKGSIIFNSLLPDSIVVSAKLNGHWNNGHEPEFFDFDQKLVFTTAEMDELFYIE